MERELEYWAPGATEPRAIRVHIEIPVQDVATAQGTDWSCRLRIAGFDEPYSMRFHQVDPIGAMLAAMAVAPAVLRSLMQHGGRLTWLGLEDLGFPLLSAPTQDWQLNPSDGGPPRRLSIRIGHPERIGEQWSALVTAIDYGRGDESDDYTTLERRAQGPTMARALELAAGLAPSLLQELVDKAGGGALVAADDAPACGLGA